MSLAPIPTTFQLTDGRGRIEPTYQAWLASIQQWLGPQGQYGTTAARPTKNLWIGLQYFDQTLGYPVFVKQISPSIVWVNYNGTTV